MLDILARDRSRADNTERRGVRNRTKARVRTRVGARMRIKASTRPMARIGPGHG